MQTVIRIGTRRSKLSLWQANHVGALVQRHHPGVRVEIRKYATRSDRNPATPLRDIAGRGIFTDALERALRSREIDCAVHSLKDLPVDIAAGLALAAVPERGDHRDALVSRHGEALALLPPGARIGVGSLRRRAQLLALRPDLKMLDIRGNVPTRLEKLDSPASPFDAIVLAVAGLQRLALLDRVSQILEAPLMICAAGQGALALQCREEEDALAFFAPLNHPPSHQAVTAERAFLAALEGGCSLPIAAHAWLSGGRLRLWGRVSALDGSRQIDAQAETPALDEAAARQLALRLADEALAQGASQLLAAKVPGDDDE